MRFLVDESTGPLVAKWLREHGHGVLLIYDEMRGVDDDTVIQTAFSEDRILITNDKDFGEMVFRENKPHHGIVPLRLSNDRSKNKVHVLDLLLKQSSNSLYNRFVVATEKQVRIR